MTETQASSRRRTVLIGYSLRAPETGGVRGVAGFDPDAARYDIYYKGA